MLGLKNRPVFSNKTRRKDNKKENPTQPNSVKQTNKCLKKRKKRKIICIRRIKHTIKTSLTQVCMCMRERESLYLGVWMKQEKVEIGLVTFLLIYVFCLQRVFVKVYFVSSLSYNSQDMKNAMHIACYKQKVKKKQRRGLKFEAVVFNFDSVPFSLR